MSDGSECSASATELSEEPLIGVKMADEFGSVREVYLDRETAASLEADLSDALGGESP